MVHVGRRWSRALLVLMLAVLLTAGLPGQALGQATGVRYFSQTGHSLRGAFRSFWESRGGVALFGLPITEEYTRRSDGKIVQYFERARFELRVNGGQALIDLGLIGREASAGRDFGRIGSFPSTATQRYFPETGHSLRGTFKNFWDRNGNLAIFGLPISEEINEQLSDGVRIVQYFERARFELRGTSVGLGLLGRALAPCALTGGVPSNNIPNSPLAEPSDTRPCSGSPASSGGATGRVYPAVSAPGTVLGFDARGYAPNEFVSLWLNIPGGGIRPLPYQAIAGGDGAVLIGFRTQANDPVGGWTLVGQGTTSGRQVVASFTLRR